MNSKIIIGIIVVIVILFGALFLIEEREVPIDDDFEFNSEEVEEMTVSLYFLQIVDGQEEVVAVAREIPATVAVGKASIEELLKGPSVQEKDAGYSTAIPEKTELLSIDIQDGVAIVDFNEDLQAGVAGSAWVTSIREQIEKTLLQFETVDGVVIMVNGESKEVLQP